MRTFPRIDRAKVAVAARNVQLRRFFDEHIYTNAQMSPRHLRKYCVLTTECEKIMENAISGSAEKLDSPHVALMLFSGSGR